MVFITRVIQTYILPSTQRIDPINLILKKRNSAKLTFGLLGEYLGCTQYWDELLVKRPCSPYMGVGHYCAARTVQGEKVTFAVLQRNPFGSYPTTNEVE